MLFDELMEKRKGFIRKRGIWCSGKKRFFLLHTSWCQRPVQRILHLCHD